ncbi:MAG: hypothetical protein ABR521_04935 [Gaiellaceae bacterium]
MSTMLRRGCWTAAVIVGLTAAVAVSAAFGSAGAGSATIPAQLATVRKALERYADVDRALADGYVEEKVCVTHPKWGTMGYHYANPKLLRDRKVNALKPELLLYVGTGGGGRKLVGVEYFRADADQNLKTDSDRPLLFGYPFDGPMPGHAKGMPRHYDLHVWLWAPNPLGLFAPFNPAVRC